MPFELTLLDIGIRLLIGMVIGFTIGLSGVGGGSLLIPALVLLLRLETTVAVGTASLFGFLAKILATYKHSKLKTIDWSSVKLFLVGAAPGSVAIAIAINHHRSHLSLLDAVAFQRLLLQTIAWVFVGTTLLMILKLLRNRTSRASASDESNSAPLSNTRRGGLVLAGLFTGILIGGTSIGGAVLIIPILMLIARMKADSTVGTSIAISLILSLITAGIYSSNGQVDIMTAVIMFIGSLAGINWGSTLSTKLKERTLTLIIIALMVVAAASMLLKKSPSPTPTTSSQPAFQQSDSKAP